MNLRSISSDKRNVKLINIEHWWNDNEIVKSKDLEKILFHLNFVHHKSHTDCPVIAVLLNYTQHFSSCLTEHTVRVHYKNQWVDKT